MSWLTTFFKFREKSDGDLVKPFLDHMEDLRWTIIKMATSLMIAMVVAFWYRVDLMKLLRAPIAAMNPTPTLMTTGIADSFIISIELAFFAGIVMAFPFLVYFFADFVLPALTRRERKSLLPGIAAGFILFVVGVLISYKFILPATLTFFYRDAQGIGINPMWTWTAYFSFSAWLCFGFGAMCELPVVVIVLAILGFVRYPFLARTRPYAITIILILTAIIAPSPDPMTFITLSMPVLALYEICIWIVWMIDRRRGKGDSGKDFPD